MANRYVKCKFCNKERVFTTTNTTFNRHLGLAKDNMISYARYYFCNLECLVMYKHCKNDNCCIHKKKVVKITTKIKNGYCSLQQYPI